MRIGPQFESLFLSGRVDSQARGPHGGALVGARRSALRLRGACTTDGKSSATDTGPETQEGVLVMGRVHPPRVSRG